MFGQHFSFENGGSAYGGSRSGIGWDNYLTETGIVGSVEGIGAVPMSDSKAKDNGDQVVMPLPEEAALATAEGVEVRNSCAGQVEAVKAANPNLSDGSVQNWANKTRAEKLAHAEGAGQDASLELIERKPSGKEVVIAARQMFTEIESKSQTVAPTQDLAEVDNRPIKDYGYEVNQVADKQVIKSGVEYQAGKPPEVTEQSLLAKIGSLPLDQQAQVIGAGIQAFRGEMSHQQFRIGVGAITGLGEGVVGLAQGAESLGNAIIGVAQFSRDVVANDPAAAETAGKAGESLGKLLVGGVRVYSAAEVYLESLGAATNVGDYGKALRDVAWLGQQMDSRWAAMTPEEKTRLTTKLAIENLGGLTVGLGTDKLAKSIKITEALEALGAEASAMAPGVREKAGKLISRLTDELLPQPMGVTPDGRLMPIPREQFKNDANVFMSKADDGLGENIGKPGEVPRTGNASKSLDERDIVNPIDRNGTTEEKIAQLQALSAENKPLVDNLLKRIDTECGTTSEISFKAPQDIADKAKRPSIKDSKDWFDVEHVRDACRFRTPVENLRDLPVILKELMHSGFTVVKSDVEKLLTPKERGWRMAAIDLRAPNGQIVEYQIVPKEMYEAGKIEHQMYKSAREKDVASLSQAEKIEHMSIDKKARNLYQNAWSTYLRRTNQSETEVRKFIELANETLGR